MTLRVYLNKYAMTFCRMIHHLLILNRMHKLMIKAPGIITALITIADESSPADKLASMTRVSLVNIAEKIQRQLRP